MGSIHRFGHTLDVNCRKKLYHAFVAPHLRFCVPVWGYTNAGTRCHTDRALLRATRIILNNRKAELSNDSYLATGISMFSMFVRYHTVCRIFIIITNSTVHYYLGTRLANEGAIYSTRNAAHNKIVPIKHSCICDELCFQLQAVSDWNALPHEIHQQHHLQCLKTAYLIFFHLIIFSCNRLLSVFSLSHFTLEYWHFYFT